MLEQRLRLMSVGPIVHLSLSHWKRVAFGCPRPIKHSLRSRFDPHRAPSPDGLQVDHTLAHPDFIPTLYAYFNLVYISHIDRSKMAQVVSALRIMGTRAYCFCCYLRSTQN